MKINKQTTSLLRDELNEAVLSVAEKHGVTIKFGNASYDDDTIKFTNVMVSLEGALSQTEKDLENVKPFHSDVDFDKVAKVRGHEFKIIGYRTRSRKNNWIVLDKRTDKKYVLPLSSVQDYFKKANGVAI